MCLSVRNVAESGRLIEKDGPISLLGGEGHLIIRCNWQCNETPCGATSQISSFAIPRKDYS